MGTCWPTSAKEARRLRSASGRTPSAARSEVPLMKFQFHVFTLRYRPLPLAERLLLGPPDSGEQKRVIIFWRAASVSGVSAEAKSATADEKKRHQLSNSVQCGGRRKHAALFLLRTSLSSHVVM
jgi:hypothetical protein